MAAGMNWGIMSLLVVVAVVLGSIALGGIQQGRQRGTFWALSAVLLGLAAKARLVLYDVKEIDPARHRAFTGQGNDRILATNAALQIVYKDD